MASLVESSDRAAAELRLGPPPPAAAAAAPALGEAGQPLQFAEQTQLPGQFGQLAPGQLIQQPQDQPPAQLGSTQPPVPQPVQSA
eukprot:2090295-Rhodomonas_salina.2